MFLSRSLQWDRLVSLARVLLTCKVSEHSVQNDPVSHYTLVSFDHFRGNPQHRHCVLPVSHAAAPRLPGRTGRLEDLGRHFSYSARQGKAQSSVGLLLFFRLSFIFFSFFGKKKRGLNCCMLHLKWVVSYLGWKRKIFFIFCYLFLAFVQLQCCAAEHRHL